MLHRPKKALLRLLTQPLAVLRPEAGLMILCGLALAGCGKQETPGVTTIRWVVDPNPIRQEQIAGFEKTNPGIKVNLDPDSGNQKVLTQLAGGINPDLFAIYDPASIRVFAKKDVLEDLAPWMKKCGVSLSDFWPGLSSYIQQEGIVCGLPDNCGPFVVFYNRRLLREAGLQTPKAGWTWDQFLDYARILTRKDARGRTTQFGAGYIEPWIIFWQYGAQMYSADGKRCTVDSPEAKKAARFWVSLRLTERVTPSQSEEQSMASLGGWGGAGNLFKAERLGMYIAGRWMSIEYRKNKKLDWDVLPVPQLPGGIKTTLLASKVYAIPKGCKNKEAAFKFLKYLVSKEDELIVSSTGDGIPSVMKYGKAREFLFNPAYPNERNNQVWLDEMRNARSPELSQYVSNLDSQTIFNEEMDIMWQRRQSSDQACDNIAKRINSLIRRNIANPNLMD